MYFRLDPNKRRRLDLSRICRKIRSRRIRRELRSRPRKQGGV